MKAVRLLSTLAVSLLMLLAAGPVPHALAVPPDFQVIPVDATLISPFFTNACGFEVMRHNVGTIRVHLFYDQNGNLVREIDQVNYDSILSANGHTLTTITRGIDQVFFRPDGSVTLMSPGPFLFLVSGGQGPIAGGTGLIVTEVDADGNVTIIREVGYRNFDFSAACAALAP